MRYHITGINHDKGSHMTLDIDAPSKAAAEKMASHAGMDVQHIQDVTNHHEAHERQTHRGEDPGEGSGWIVKWIVGIVVVVVIVAIAALVWVRIRMNAHH